MTKHEREQENLSRIERMSDFDKSIGEIVVGVDEAGRGPLAGPVVACACIIEPSSALYEINDSKKLSEKKREALYEIIIRDCISYSVGVVDNNIIDEINILNATKMAMSDAINNIGAEYDGIITDYVALDGFKNLHAVVKGDSQSFAVACASVVAKVYRDRLMRDYAKLYGEYGFESHKGYPTKKHYEMIEKYGVLPIHRRSFLKNIKL